MASFLCCMATSAAWCCCTASTSLLNSCCGNDNASNNHSSATSVRQRSVFLLILSIGFAFAFQYGVGPKVQSLSISNYVTNAWTDGCLNYETDALQERCVGNNGVYRATSAALVFFTVAAMAVAFNPTANRDAWPAKYIMFVFLVLGTCFIPNDPLFSSIYLQVARIGGILFMIAQQVIILDLAFNWNDSWVEKSNKAEIEEAGSGKKWLGAILASCVLMFGAALLGIVLMYVYFSGCGENLAFITITTVMSVVVTVAQMTSDEGSLLSSGVITGYATFLCYTAVGKNPNEECNPLLGEGDVLGILLGVGVTVISLAWTGWSSTADDKIGGKELKESLVEERTPKKDNSERHVAGVVTGGPNDGDNADEESNKGTDGIDDVPPTGLTNSWKLNLILGILSCWVAMVLTGWGSIQAGGNAANPDVAKVSMWMIITSQWIVLLLYLWALCAPRLFPGRDFS